jgi:hypothetical protein
VYVRNWESRCQGHNHPRRWDLGWFSIRRREVIRAEPAGDPVCKFVARASASTEAAITGAFQHPMLLSSIDRSVLVTKEIWPDKLPWRPTQVMDKRYRPAHSSFSVQLNPPPPAASKRGL